MTQPLSINDLLAGRTQRLCWVFHPALLASSTRGELQVAFRPEGPEGAWVVGRFNFQKDGLEEAAKEVRAGADAIAIPEHDHTLRGLPAELDVGDVIAAAFEACQIPPEDVEFSAILIATVTRRDDTVSHSILSLDGGIWTNTVVMRNHGPFDASGVREHSHSDYRKFPSVREAMAYCEAYEPPPVEAAPCACEETPAP